MDRDTLQRLYEEEEGVEVVEWAIVAVFCAVAGSLVWRRVSDAVEAGLENVVNLF